MFQMDATRPERLPDHARPAERLAPGVEPHEHGCARQGTGDLLRRGLGNYHLEALAATWRGGSDRDPLDARTAEAERAAPHCAISRGMSASGAGTVSYKYSPEAGDK